MIVDVSGPLTPEEPADDVLREIVDYSPVAIRPVEELVVRRNLPRATSDLLELAGITNSEGKQVEICSFYDCDPTESATPRPMIFHYLVRAGRCPGSAASACDVLQLWNRRAIQISLVSPPFLAW